VVESVPIPAPSRLRFKDWVIPKTGEMRPLHGRMHEAVYGPWEQRAGTTRVSLDGHPGLKVTLRTEDFNRLVRVHGLVRTRWLLEDGEVRAYGRNASGKVDKETSYSVAALLLRAKDGDTIHLEDCLDLRPERMRLERKGR
jgi:hypothetical protein